MTKFRRACSIRKNVYASHVYFIVVRLDARRQGIVKGSSLFLLAADKALVELSWFRSGAVYDKGLDLYTCVNT